MAASRAGTPAPLPSSLPTAFTYTQARAGGVSERRLYALRDAGAIEQLGRGLFQRAESLGSTDSDLTEIALRAPRATLCMTTAMARHGLTDAIPDSIDVALPRGRRRPRTEGPIAWHTFATETFDIGRTELELIKGTVIGLYSAERCVIDVFRLRHLEGPEQAVEALRRWLRRRGNQPADLLRMARAFPKAEPALRSALEILL